MGTRLDRMYGSARKAKFTHMQRQILDTLFLPHRYSSLTAIPGRDRSSAYLTSAAPR